MREKLKAAIDNLILATENLRRETKVHEVAKTVFKFRDVQKILFAHYIALKKDREKLLTQKMKENIFLASALKKYREGVRSFDKHKNSLHTVQKNYLTKKLEVEKKRLENFYALPTSQKKSSTSPSAFSAKIKKLQIKLLGWACR